jgi:(p)ppGpp synthase/HD superfamily hydrolase
VAIAAGLLHDIVEDTQTPIERIRELFGRTSPTWSRGDQAGAIRSPRARSGRPSRKMPLAMVDDIRTTW